MTSLQRLECFIRLIRNKSHKYHITDPFSKSFDNLIFFHGVPIMRKAFPCHEVIMVLLLYQFVISAPMASQYRVHYTVYPKKYAHGFVVLCFVVVMQSFIMNSHEVFIHIHQGCFAGTGAIIRLPQCQWSKPDGYGKNQSMYNHNKA